MRHLLAFLLLVCTGASTFAQNSIDLFTIGAQYGFPSDYETPIDGQAQETIYSLNAKLPVPIGENDIWYSNLSYYNFNVDTDSDIPEMMANPLGLHAIILQTGLYHHFSEDKGFMLLAMPRLMSDFDGGSSFQFGGIAMYEKRFHDRLLMRFGASYNQELFGPFFVPLVFLNWQFGEDWSIEGLLPIYMKVKKQINENFSVGFHEFALVMTFPLNEDYNEDYIERNAIELSLFARHRVKDNIHAELRAGYSLSRSYEQFAENQMVDWGIPTVRVNDERPVLNVPFNDGPFISARLVYNLPLGN